MSIDRSFYVSLFLLFLLSFTAPVQAGTILPTHFLPGDDTVAAAAGDQQSPAIARGGSQFLVVWADTRSKPTGTWIYTEFETSSDIYAMRLDASGNQLDALPIPVANGKSTQENPQVSWNGTNWLVVYESYSISGTGFYYQKSLEAVRVSPAGQVLDQSPIVLYSLVPMAGMWSVASDGNNWAIAFQGSSSSYDLMALRVSPEGVMLDPPTHTLIPATYYLRFNLRLAFASGVYLLTWSDFSDTLAVRFDQNLTPLDAAPITMVAGFNLSDLASNGSQFYVVWVGEENFVTTVKGSRVSPAGIVLDGSGVNISQSHSPDPFTDTSVDWDGANWKVTWSFAGVSVARVDAGGQVLDPGGIAVAGIVAGPTAASSNGDLQIAWTISDYTLQNSFDVQSASILANNTAGPILTLSSSSPSQVRPDVAAGSSGYMMVFRSDLSRVNRVMAQPLDGGGNPLTSAPILLDSGDSTNGPTTPSVAWNGSLYLATWSNSSGVVAQRIQQDGTLVDATPFFVMPGFGPSDAAAMGDVFLVTGLKININPEFVFPAAARVQGSTGVVLDTTALILGNSFARSPAVDVVGGRWLVVWESHPTHDNPIASTNAAFVDAGGAVTAEFMVYGGYSTSSYTYGPSVASNGSVAFVLQTAEVSSGVELDLVGRMVNADGTLQIPVTLTPWLGNQYRPRVAWDGNWFIVAFQDQRNRLAEWELDQLDARSDLFGMRVTAAGSIIDPRGFLFSNSADAEGYPTITANNGISLIAGSILLQAPHAAYRIGYERFGVGANAWPVAVASATPNSGDVPLEVAFSSSASSDPDGSIVDYAWDFGDGATSTDPNPNHTYTTGVPFVATLTVTDNAGAQTTNTVLIKATYPNQNPVAHATANPTSGAPPLDVVFDASGSYDPDGWLGNHHWAFSDGGEYWGIIAYHTFESPGTYTATLTAFDNRNGTGTATVTIQVGAFADLSIVKTDSPDPVSQGATLTYTIAVTNSGPSTATGVTVVDNLPAGVTFVSSTNPGCVHSNGTVTCALGTLSNGNTTTFQIAVTAGAPGTVTNSATVSAAQADSNPADNTDSEPTTILPLITADLSVANTDSPDPVIVGGSVTYTIDVTNNGPANATGVVMTDTLPAEISFASASAGCTLTASTVTCAIGNLNAGATATVTIIATATTAGTAANTAVVSANEADSVPGNNTDIESTTINDACLFCDDFEDGVLATNWTYVKSSTFWSESGGNMIGANNRKTTAVADGVFTGCTLCSVEASIQTAGGRGNRIWLFHHYVNSANMVELMMREDKDLWILRQRIGKAVVAKVKTHQTIDPNTIYTARIDYDGTNYLVFVDGTQIMTLPAVGPVSGGTVGFGVKGTTGTFGSLVVN